MCFKSLTLIWHFKDFSYRFYFVDMDIPDLSVESINVSKILAAHGFTLPVVKLRQEEAMYQCNILKIFNAHHTDPVLMPCGSRLPVTKMSSYSTICLLLVRT